MSSGADVVAARSHEGAVWGLTAAMAATAIGVVIIGADHLGAFFAEPVVPWAILLGLFIATDIWVVHLPVGRNRWSFSLSEIPLFLAVLTLSPVLTVGLRTAGAAIGLPMARVRGVKLGFNIASAALEAAVAVVVHRALLADGDPLGPRSWLACVGAALVINALNGVSICAAIWLRERTNALSQLAGMVTTGAVSVLANTGLAIVSLIVIEYDPWAATALVPLAGTLLIALRAWTALHQRFDHLQAVHDFIAALGEVSGTADTAERVLEESRRLLRAQRAQLVVADDTGAAWLFSLGAVFEDGPISPPWWPGLLATGPAIIGPGSNSATDHGFRDAVVVPLLASDGTRGALLVADRNADEGTFDSRDLRVLELLAGHAAARLQAAELLDEVREEAAEKEHQSLHDWLTGLPNRRHFMDRAALAIASDPHAAVLVIDLDRFKQINDTLGHWAGDRILNAVAGRLSGDRLVPPDALVARLGGDEFAILLPATDVTSAVATAERVLRGLVAPVAIDGLAIEVGASVGVAASPVHGSDADALLQHADVAMYVAKRGGTSIEAYSADRDDNDVRRLALVTELRHAIDDGGIDVHYQPLVGVRDGRLVGVECLVRWTSPSYGPVEPDEFIPMAETTGLITPLTELVLERSLAQCASWRADGYEINVSVNLSMRNLIAADLSTLVERHLTTSAVPGNALTLELTESCLIGDTDRTATVLNQLRALGVRVSIDDFGTGYSSLSYLSRLPVDELKIDRSFVAAMGNGGGASTIVRAATHLAHDLGLVVVAEGVEDVDTWRAVADTGCDAVQGYLISRPQPAEPFALWLARHRRQGTAVFIDVPTTPRSSTLVVDGNRPLRLAARSQEPAAATLAR